MYQVAKISTHAAKGDAICSLCEISTSKRDVRGQELYLGANVFARYRLVNWAISAV
jgi:hypothetical protein